MNRQPISKKKRFDLDKYDPKYIMSIHGWNSNRQWQIDLSNSLNSLGYTAIAYTYGRKIFKIFKCHIMNDVSKFKTWYFQTVNNRKYDIDIDKPFYRPSIMAHSLGSWILVQSLLKYPEIKFDKIFLFGAIVPSDFDWFKIILNDQVNNIIYERSKNDKVVFLAPLVTCSFRTCTRNGFLQKSILINEEKLDLFGHTDFSYSEHLVKIVKKYMSEIPHQLCAVFGRNIDQRIVKKYFKETLKIDNQVFTDLVYQESAVSIEMGLDWFEIEPDIWTFVKHTYSQTISGYINAIPVDDKTYNDFISGKLKENEINQGHILPYNTCKPYNLLILSIAIKKHSVGSNSPYSKKITEVLLMAFLNKHLQLNSRLKRFAAIAWSASGKNLCEGFGMSQIGTDENDHGIFAFDTKEVEKLNYKNTNFMAKWLFKNLKN